MLSLRVSRRVPHKDKLTDERWCTTLAYLADIFWHLNELNVKLQGKNENILSSTDKIQGFMGKLILWHEALEQGSMDMFPLASAAPQAARQRDVFAEHFQTLKERFFNDIFPCVTDIEDYDKDLRPIRSGLSNGKPQRGNCRASYGQHSETQT